ncbi:metal ABC transporter substrate-binding protein [Anaerostipes sp. 494a]|uniref:MetQ/NlpA family ABC transporter substrate-binding protein n=1 Tax=Anaerostipes TaxID=207244 RepID=UPI000950D5C4|nr:MULTISPECIES: MetQ/NlpA family ABC transporter substrate-binding protein [Anaerostipes]MDY2726538.1 MetQ/NlpA family ABC transporter substrate-binding protein [Anaerostipes faecalis]OLR60222.1 metal ABC transporter substrate-binding protein [Anaerostipes sp. 494a]
MKKLWKKALAIVLSGTFITGALTGCGVKKEDSSEKETKRIVVGASPSPHADILKVAKKQLKKEGYELVIKEYSDYVQPNTALEAGDLDANYFQHKPYLDDFNKQKKTHIVSAGVIHYEPFGIFPGKIKSLKDLKEGSVVAVPNDTTNEARALLLLEAQGLIKLKDGAALTATKKDIVENKKNLEIKELEAAQIPRSLKDVDIAVVNGNYALEADLEVNKDALAVEDADSLGAKTYGNIVAVKKGNEKSDATKALVKALKSDEVKDYIEKNYNGAVVPLF